MQDSKRLGFTLIELLVSIGVVAVIAAGVVSLIGNGPRRRARDSRRQADIQRIATALELYRADKGVYPTTGNLGQLLIAPIGGQAYLSQIPVDPSRNTAYGNPNTSGAQMSQYISNGGTFTLCVDLEAIAAVNCNEAIVQSQ